MRLDGHKVLVTAGTGLALAKSSREAGYQVAICGRDPKMLDAAARDVEATPIRAAKVQLLYWSHRFAPGVAERALRGI